MSIDRRQLPGQEQPSTEPPVPAQVVAPPPVRSRFRRPTTKHVREFTWLTASNQVALPFSLFTMVLLVRTVSPIEVGQVAFAQSVAGVIFLVLDPRFPDAVQRYVPLLRQESESRARALYWRLLRWHVLLGIGVTTIAGTLWLVQAYPRTSVCRPEFLALAISATALGSAVGTLNAGFAVTDGLTTLGRRSVAASLVVAVLTMVSVLLFGAIGYLAAAVIATGIRALWFLPYCIRNLQVRPGTSGTDRPDRSLPEGFWRFLVSASFSISLAVGSESGMLAVAGLAGGPELVAMLRVAGAPGRLLQAAFSPIAVQLFPRLATLAASRDRVGVQRLTAYAVRLLLIPAALAVAAGVPLMRSAIGFVYGHRYESASRVAMLLLLAGALRVLIIWAKILPLAVGRSWLRIAPVAFESTVVIAAAFIVPRFATGAAAAGTGIGVVVVIVATSLAAFWLWTSRRADLLGGG